MRRLRVHTNAEIDPALGRPFPDRGWWVVELDGRIIKRGSAYSCARYAAEIRRLNPDENL